MVLGLSLLGRKQRNVKDYILIILLEEFPLRTKALYTKLKKKYALSVTYQAVHKAVTQLEENGLVQRTEEGYSLHQDWIQKVELFIEMYKAHYTGSEEDYTTEIKELKKDGDSKILSVPTLFEAMRIQMYIRDRFREKFFDTPFEKKPIRVNNDYHVYRFVTNPYDTHQGYQQPKYRFPIYYLIEGKTAVDQESVALVKTYPGVKDVDKFLLGERLPRGCQLAVYDDLVLEMHLPRELRKRVDSYFGRAKDLSDFNTLGYFKEVVVAPFKIKVVLYKDRELADSIVQETRAYFK